MSLIAFSMGDLESAGRFAELAVGRDELGGVIRVPGLLLLACVSVAKGQVERAAELLAEWAALQRQRGCVTSGDLTQLVQEAEATCRTELGAAYDRIRQTGPE